MLILYIALGASVSAVAGGFIVRKILRDMKLKNLAYVIHEGKLLVEMSDLSKMKGTTLLKGEVVGTVEDDQFVFHAYSCPVTGHVERVKFWIGDAVFEETMLTDKSGAQAYLGLTRALDAYLRQNGKTAILPEARA